MKNEEFNEKVWEEYTALKRRIVRGIRIGAQVIITLILICLISYVVVQGVSAYIWR